MALCTNKMLEVIHEMEKKQNKSLSNVISKESLDDVATELASEIKGAIGFGEHIVSIARKQILMAIDILYGKQITSNNLTNLINFYDYDLLRKVQGKLHIYSNDAEYEFKQNPSGKLEIVLYPEDSCPAKLLETLLLDHTLDPKTMNVMWSKANVLGDKRTHFNEKVVESLRDKGFSNIIWPTCKSKPRTFSQLIRPSFILKVIKDNNSQSEFESALAKLNKAKPALPKRVAAIIKELKGEQIETANVQFQNLPYFYIYKTSDGAKIGSADSTHRISNKEGPVSQNNAMIFCLARAGEHAMSAQTVEGMFRNYLSGLRIDPIKGKRDHYTQDYVDMLSVFVSFVKKESVIQKVQTDVFVCANYEYQ